MKSIGILGTIQIIFIILKLVNVITWNWYLVFIPAYISILLTALIYLGCFIVAVISAKIDNIDDDYKREE